MTTPEPFNPNAPFVAVNGKRYACVADWLVDKPLICFGVDQATLDSWSAAVYAASRKKSYFKPEMFGAIKEMKHEGVQPE